MSPLQMIIYYKVNEQLCSVVMHTIIYTQIGSIVADNNAADFVVISVHIP